ncbi:MAG: NUDIX hydrolase [Chitinophagaceae bacterium]
MQPETQKILELAKRIKAIAQRGLTYSTDEYNIERYTELETISHELFEVMTDTPWELIRNFYLNKKEYPTPKTDIRGVVFNEKNEILLVCERDDNKWSLPGGWADIGYSPKEIAVKEVEEETGFIVVPTRLLAVLDKKHHPHPPQLEYAYKLFIQCTLTGGKIREAHDITDVAFFPQDSIPSLSQIRVTASQIDLMFAFLHNPGKEVVFD